MGPAADCIPEEPCVNRLTVNYLNHPPDLLLILSQVVNGIVLPFVLIFMLLLVNKKDLMGEYVISRLYNVVAWATTLVMVALTLAWFWTLRGGSG